MYKDLNRKFHLFDFNMSHNEMIIRSFKNPKVGENENVDILFKGVMSLNIITTFKGLEIVAVEKKSNLTCKIVSDVDLYIFRLTDKFGTEAYIEASAFGVFNNKLEFNESSLGDFMWTEENKCIYWSHEDVEFKKKFKIR